MSQLSLFGEEFQATLANDETYEKKVEIPLYSPSAKCPNICSLVDCAKTSRLIKEIENSKVSYEEKKFLIEAAHRHSIFNYSRIADYYAHSSREMQELMEKSALVIIDFDKAIANGYVKLSDNIRRIQEETGRKASSEYKNQHRDTTKK